MAEESVGTEGQGNTETPATETSWTDGLSDEYKSHELLTGYDSLDSLAKNHVDINNKLREVEGSIPKPPESVDAYKFDVPAEGAQIDESLETEFKAFALENKMQPELASKIRNFQLSAINKKMEAMAAKETEGLNVLKTEWGGNHDKNVELAKRVITKFGGEEFAEFLNTSRLGNNPTMIKVMHKIGTLISEEHLELGTNQTTPSGPKVDSFGRPMLDFPSMKK